MNLLLLEESDLTGDNTATISDDRLQHIQKVLSANVGDTLSCGLLNNNMGTATITAMDHSSAILSIILEKEPPKPLPLTVILALPRPAMLQRICRNIAEFGIKELYLIHSNRVEKSYWQSPSLEEQKIRSFLKEGLSQSKDTLLPNIYFKKRFKPFVEDELASIIANKEAFVAHPYQAKPIPSPSSNERVIAIGPEGGFIDYEINLLKQQGMQPVSMGERIYRVENAVTLLSNQLSC